MLKYLKEALGSMFNTQIPLATFTHCSSGILSVTFYKVLEEAMHTGTLRTMENELACADLGEAGHLSDFLKLGSLFNFTRVVGILYQKSYHMTFDLISLTCPVNIGKNSLEIKFSCRLRVNKAVWQ